MDMHSTAMKAFLLLGAGLSVLHGIMPMTALSQANLRSSFPGRRVGGGTRGECSARILAHLVPNSSVFAPGATSVLGLVQGPTANPVSLNISFQPKSGGASTTRTLPAAPAALILISGSSFNTPTVWESEFDCATADGSASNDPLAFVETTSPPAVSLLVPEPDASDAPVQAALKKLRNSCGATVPAKATLGQFGLADIVTAEWPQNLPVRCPS
jgi:hypothetical protein